MNAALTKAADAVLKATVESNPGVPGVVAMVTDRKGTIYEGAAGSRVLGGDQAMTTDTVFAIFSTPRRSPARPRCSWSRRAGWIWRRRRAATRPTSASSR